jgi:hypothetical protein
MIEIYSCLIRKTRRGAQLDTGRIKVIKRKSRGNQEVIECCLIVPILKLANFSTNCWELPTDGFTDLTILR